jgi:hypothetical protein
MCRCFPSTLKKDANKWFLRLLPRSFNSYKQLTELFLAQFAYNDKKDHTTQIGSELPANLENELVTFLRKNVDLFAWTPADMPGIDPSSYPTSS